MKIRFLIVAALALASGAEAQDHPCDAPNENKGVALQIEFIFKTRPSADAVELLFFDNNGMFKDRVLHVPATLKEGKWSFSIDKYPTFYPEEYFVAAVGPLEWSALCVPGKGIRKAALAPCTGSFALELTKKPRLKVVIVAPKAAEVGLTTEIPRSGGGVCRRAHTVIKRPEIQRAIEVIDGEGVALAVKSNSADRTATALGCSANPADARSDSMLIMREASGHRGPVAENQALIVHCKDVKVRVLK